jgi:hypothetical protein
MPSLGMYKSYKLGENVNLEKIINLLGVHKPMSIKPLFLTLNKNANIFMKNHAKVQNQKGPQ